MDLLIYLQRLHDNQDCSFHYNKKITFLMVSRRFLAFAIKCQKMTLDGNKNVL